jgi:hypothetical protein
MVNKVNATRRRTRPDWAGRFLAALRRSANIKTAAAASGIGRTTVYQRRNRDAQFARQLAEVLEAACLQRRRRG